MRPVRGPIILPEKRLRRFRLPDMPPEPESRRATRSVVQPVLMVCGWLAVTGTCFALSEGGFAWPASGRDALQPAEEAPDPIAVMEARKREQSQAHRAAVAPPETTPTVRLVTAKLAPLRRQAPDAHSGTGRAFLGARSADPDDGSWAADWGNAGSEQARGNADFGAQEAFDKATDSHRPAVSYEPTTPHEPATSYEPATSQAPADSNVADSGEVWALPSQPAVEPPPLRGSTSARSDTDHAAARAAASRPVEPSREDRADDSSRGSSSSKVWTTTRLRGCEAAAAAHVEELNTAEQQAPDVPRQAYARQLEDFDQYGRCDLNLEMNVSICVAVRGGKTQGVTVRTQPANARLADCIASAVQNMRFPSSPHMDVVRTELIVR